MMSNDPSPRSNWLMISFTVAALVALTFSGRAQDVPAVHVGYSAVTGVPQDWSHHHLVFSNPGTEQQSIKSGKYTEWLQVVNDPRYVMQQMRRNAVAHGPSAQDLAARQNYSKQFAPVSGSGGGLGPRTPVDRFSKPSFQSAPLNKDWNSNLTLSAIMPNTYPAKYSFSTTGTPSCANDYVVYPTGATGSGTAATILAFNNIYPGVTAPGCGSLTPETVYWAFNTGAAAVTTSPVLSLNGSELAFIQSNGTTASLVLLKWAKTPATITTATGSVTSSSTSITATTNISAADVGMQITDTTHATCIPANDTIVAYSAGTVTLQTATSGTCGTHAGDALTLTAESVTTPGLPTSVTAANFASCTAPCMYSAALSGNPNDTFSSPYYDYENDILYVGDNVSKLHKFTGVFLGTPTEVTPVTLNATSYTVASPVYDALSGCVFVGDSEGDLYSVNSGLGGTGTCNSATFSLNATSTVLGAGANDGIFDAPLVDSTAGTVYVFVTDSAAVSGRTVTVGVTNFSTTFSFSGTTVTAADIGKVIVGTDISAGTTITAVNAVAHTGTLSAVATGTDATDSVTIAPVGPGEEAVDQFPTSFGAGAQPTSADAIGTGASAEWQFAGSFDNTYYTSANGSSPSGNIWVIGNQAAPGGAIYEVPIASNVMGAAVSKVTVNGTHPAWASPVTEFYNSNTGVDSIYFSFNRPSVVIGPCNPSTGNGCIAAYNVTTTTPVLEGSTKFGYPNTSGNPGCFGTSAFIIDNGTSSTDTSNVYFVYFGGDSPSTVSSACQTVTGATSGAYSESQEANF